MTSKWYGNVINRILENGKDPEITVGMGVTEYWWSDRDPYEVTRIKDQKHLWIRPLRHKYKRVGQYDGEIELFSDTEANEIYVVKRGKYWYTEGTTIDDNGKEHKAYYRKNIGFGRADYYCDPSF